MVQKVSDRKLKQQAKTDAKQAVEQDVSADIDAKFKKKNPIWIPLTFAMAVTILFAMFYSDLGTSSLIGGMIGCGLFGGAVAKYLDKDGFVGFGIGSAFGVIANIGMSYLKYFLYAA